MKRGGVNCFLSESEAITFFQHIVNGFKTLNALKIIHRDIKPPNILIHNGNAKIADFGFARFTDDINEKAFMTEGIGTPLYMAPEIYNKSSYNAKCDIWSLGILFYELLYGKTPWMGKSSYDLFVNNIQKKPLEFPAVPKRSDKVKILLQKMLTVNVETRMDWDAIFNDGLMMENLYNLKEIKAKENMNESLKRSMITNAYTINKRLVQGHLNLNTQEQEKNIENFQRIGPDNQKNNIVQNSPTHTFIENKGFDFIKNESQTEMSKQIIKKAKNFLFYERNTAFFLKMTCHLLVASFTSDKLKLDDNLLYQMIFLFQKYEMIIMKYVMLTALGKITNQEFPPEVLTIPEYKIIIRDLSSDFDECNKVFAQVNDLINDKKKIWEKAPKNMDFLKIANSEMECNETFCIVYKETISEFFKNLAFQFKCQTEGTDGEMVDGDYLKMIRYLQICSCVEGPYNFFVKTEMEDSSQMFYHFYDVMNTMEKKSLIGEIKKNWGF
jgi:serine/threonine-protein kinase ULK/ATG1